VVSGHLAVVGEAARLGQAGVVDLARVALPDVQAGRLGSLRQVPGVGLVLGKTGADADAGVQCRAVLAVILGRGVGAAGTPKARQLGLAGLGAVLS
jgi:hypothetical protein